jgi:Ca-activated chloride channel family protein
VNRVVLCTDGDFNVGVTGTGELVSLAERNAGAGVYLSVLGFGIGNLNDAMLEQISNKANGNYAFIDTPAEARKVLVEQLSGTLVTIAKDVKIQVEFNPARVAAYRLIGYENRRLADRDFNDDTKDAGEIGAGHAVTALYEVTPTGLESDATVPLVDPLKYQGDRQPASVDHGELLTVKLRYKVPDQSQSTRMDVPIRDSGKQFAQASEDYRFAAAVAMFGMVLRDSPYRHDAGCAAVHEIATGARGADRHGYRAEFLEMVRRAASLAGEELGSAEQAAVVLPYPTYPPAENHPLAPQAGGMMGNWRTILAIVIGIVIGVFVSTIAAGICLHLFFRASKQRESRWEHQKPAAGPQNAAIPRVHPIAARWQSAGAPAATVPRGR